VGFTQSKVTVDDGAKGTLTTTTTEQTVAGPPVVPPVVALLLIACVGLVQGCSLEAARNQRLNTQYAAGSTPSKPVTARPESECKLFDFVHVYGNWSAGVSSAVGAGAGIYAASSEGSAKDTAVAIGLGAAATSAVLLGVAAVSGGTWEEQCSL
jgi:hypothetical protein